MRKKPFPYHIALSLVILAFCVQGCLGIGDNGNQQNFKSVNTGNGQKISVNQGNQAIFKGKIYFTQSRNLLVLDGTRNITQLTHNEDARDPSVSPDGKWVAYVVRYKDYADLWYMSTDGRTLHKLITGKGAFSLNSGGFIQDNFYWFGQPTWQGNNKLTFLSDFQKNFDWAQLGGDFASAPFVDMQIFSLPIGNTTLSGVGNHLRGGFGLCATERRVAYG